METTDSPTTMFAARRAKGYTLRSLADAVTAAGGSVSYSQLSRIEKGTYSPHPPLAAVLARVLEVDVSLFDRP